MIDQHAWISEATLVNARQSGKKCCESCKHSRTPGYVLNAMQWVNCFQCNPTQQVKTMRFQDNLYYIAGDRLNKLEALMLRLYSENRMSGDEMRDAAQFLDTLLSDSEEMGAIAMESNDEE